MWISPCSQRRTGWLQVQRNKMYRTMIPRYQMKNSAPWGMKTNEMSLLIAPARYCVTGKDTTQKRKTQEQAGKLPKDQGGQSSPDIVQSKRILNKQGLKICTGSPLQVHSWTLLRICMWGKYPMPGKEPPRRISGNSALCSHKAQQWILPARPTTF